VPSSYSSLGFGPSNCLLQARRAFKLFESGLWSLKLSSSGQQSPQAIRDWAPVPRIIVFGSAEPSNYSRPGFVPSNYLLRAGSAFEFFELGLWSLELFSSGQQCSCLIRVRILVLRIFVSRHSLYLIFGGNIPIQMSYVKYEGKSTVFNTRWPGICIKRALSRNFPYLRYEVCTDGRIGCRTMNWASTW
jgi:hypothetical protein